jgi:hypothetical protein
MSVIQQGASSLLTLLMLHFQIPVSVRFWMLYVQSLEKATGKYSYFLGTFEALINTH